jgi:hypothetical protein
LFCFHLFIYLYASIHLSFLLFSFIPLLPYMITCSFLCYTLFFLPFVSRLFLFHSLLFALSCFLFPFFRLLFFLILFPSFSLSSRSCHISLNNLHDHA